MIKIVREEPQYYREVEIQNRNSFWDVYIPGCVEHYVIHKLRNSDAYIKELSLIAFDNNKIIGSVYCSRGNIIEDDKVTTPILILGPVSTVPEHQKEGVGSMLMNEAIRRARKFGYRAIVLYGNPEFYHLIGFVNAEKYNITTPDGKNFEAFMLLELYPNALKGVKGKCYEDAVFDVKENDPDFIKYEATFPEKIKTRTEPLF